jgi:hypothetical protein
VISMATTTADGRGASGRDFGAAVDTARDIARYKFGAESLGEISAPYQDMPGIDGALAWAMVPTWTILTESVRSDRLDDEDGAAPVPVRNTRTWLFGRDEGTPEITALHTFVNRYDDERAVVETPAPWDTPDGMTPANDLVKGLEWDDHHWSFEENFRQHGFEADDVWVVDTSGLDPLREAAEDAGYEWTEGAADPSPDAERLAEACEFLRAAEVDRATYDLTGGDKVTVRYESKQTGDVKEKTGTVTSTRSAFDPGFSFERDDGKTNKVKANGGEVGIYSTSQYPFMGTVRSVTARPEEEL